MLGTMADAGGMNATQPQSKWDNQPEPWPIQPPEQTEGSQLQQGINYGDTKPASPTAFGGKRVLTR